MISVALQPETILNVFQQVHFQFFKECGPRICLYLFCFVMKSMSDRYADYKLETYLFFTYLLGFTEVCMCLSHAWDELS
jgi:hypothetical protein